MMGLISAPAFWTSGTPAVLAFLSRGPIATPAQRVAVDQSGHCPPRGADKGTTRMQRPKHAVSF